MRTAVLGGEREERTGAEQPREVGIVFAKRVHQPVEVHVRVDARAFGGGELGVSREIGVPRSGIDRDVAGDQSREQLLRLREPHAASRASSARASAAAAASLSAMSRSSSGTCSSHSINVGTRPKRRTANAYRSHTGSATGPSCVSKR